MHYQQSKSFSGSLPSKPTCKMHGMKMSGTAICALLLAFPTVSAQATTILGNARPFSVLGGSTVTNTGPTVVEGDLGVWPGTAITGFPPGSVTGSIHATDAVAFDAKKDLTTAYNTLTGMAPTTDLTGQDLGGLTLTPGVYFFKSTAQLTGTLTLDAQGLADAVFVFQIGKTLTTASNSSVLEINGAQSVSQSNGVYFQVGSSATLGTDTRFAGNILALTSITLNTGATIDCGRALARNGAVTMDTNTVSIGSAESCGTGDGFVVASEVPEPGTVVLTSLGLIGCLAFLKMPGRTPGSTAPRSGACSGLDAGGSGRSPVSVSFIGRVRRASPMANASLLTSSSSPAWRTLAAQARRPQV
jgi:type VI secretion system secreted protein VgrG